MGLVYQEGITMIDRIQRGGACGSCEEHFHLPWLEVTKYRSNSSIKKQHLGMLLSNMHTAVETNS